MADEKDAKNNKNLEEKAKAAMAQAGYDDHNHMVKTLLLAIGAFVILAIVIIGGAMAFRTFERGRLVNDIDQRVAANGDSFGFRGGRMGMMGRGFRQDNDESANTISGTVTAVDGSKFTVSVNNSSKTVEISDATRFPITSASKVAVNDKVEVVGQQDSNGVIQANEIVVNP